jgi:hypothetical protein
VPKMYNPDTGEAVEVDGPQVRAHKSSGFVTVGNRPENEYLGLSRDELAERLGDDDDAEEAEEAEEAPPAPDQSLPDAPPAPDQSLPDAPAPG